eukprot:scaffold230211_cov19-Tisochrysis_lutea.AAC.2
MDHGYPQITDPTVLKSLITQRGFSGDLPVLAVEMMQKVGTSGTRHDFSTHASMCCTIIRMAHVLLVSLGLRYYGRDGIAATPVLKPSMRKLVSCKAVAHRAPLEEHSYYALSEPSGSMLSCALCCLTAGPEKKG